MSGLSRLREAVVGESVKAASDFISGVIRKDQERKFSASFTGNTGKITGSELDRESDYLWDLVDAELTKYGNALENEGEGAARLQFGRSVEMFKKYHREDADLARWLETAVKKI